MVEPLRLTRTRWALVVRLVKHRANFRSWPSTGGSSTLNLPVMLGLVTGSRRSSRQTARTPALRIRLLLPQGSMLSSFFIALLYTCLSFRDPAGHLYIRHRQYLLPLPRSRLYCSGQTVCHFVFPWLLEDSNWKLENHREPFAKWRCLLLSLNILYNSC